MCVSFSIQFDEVYLKYVLLVTCMHCSYSLSASTVYHSQDRSDSSGIVMLGLVEHVQDLHEVVFGGSVLQHDLVMLDLETRVVSAFNSFTEAVVKVDRVQV